MTIVLLFLISIIAACSGDKETSKANNSTENAEDNEVGDAEDFDWKSHDGEELDIMFNQHPYAEAVIEKIPEFEEKTGITVNHSITPEENYFDKLTTALNAQNGNPDVFMTGAYQVWEYATSEYMQELDSFIDDPAKTNPDYDVDDFIDGVINANRWDGVAGHAVGEGDLWTIPMGFEVNYLHYNKRAFEEVGIDSPPETMDELLDIVDKFDEWDGSGTYGIGTRGTRSWATIHPGFMTSYTNHGAVDFEEEDGSLVPQVNSPESVEITEKYAEMIQKGGPEDWANYTWYDVATDLAEGKAAMAYDASWWPINYNKEGASKEAGNLAVAPPPKSKDGDVGSNMWVWSMAMNHSSENKDAAWLFMQYFTGKEHQLWAAVDAEAVDPARQSVWDDEDFKELISNVDGYEETFNEIIDNSSVKFTPQPEFFNTTTEWAAALQDIVEGADAQERLDELNEDINDRVSRVRVE